MNITLPPPPPNYSPASFSQVFDAIRRALIPAVSRDEAVSRVLLQSPNGTVYSVTINDAGTLATTVNSGKTHI